MIRAELQTATVSAEKSLVFVDTSIPEPHCSDTVTIEWRWDPPLASGTQFKIVLREYSDFFFDSDIFVIGTFTTGTDNSTMLTFPTENTENSRNYKSRECLLPALFLTAKNSLHSVLGAWRFFVVVRRHCGRKRSQILSFDL